MPKVKKSYLILLLFLYSAFGFQSSLFGLQSENLKLNAGNSNWIDGTHDLIIRAHRVVSFSESKVYPAPAMNAPEVGEQRRFCATSFSRNGGSYFTNATCRAVGEFCYIFVEDSQWQRGIVTSTGVMRLRKAFDEATPANPSKGIYELETENFSPPPDDIDFDPKIYILILDIPDEQNDGSNFIAGYFEPINQERGVVRDPRTGVLFNSNEVEMIYIDADPLDTDGVMSREVLAHEFQHLIHWRNDPDEEIWINEGCSDYAALFLCGYGINRSIWHLESFEREPQISLVYWPVEMVSSPANYGAAFLWMMYLHEHYGGISTIASLVVQPAHGINGVNATLSSCGYSERFGNIFSDWKIANYLDDNYFASGKYGYDTLDLKIKPNIKHSSFPVSETSRPIQSWTCDYIEFTGGTKVSDLQINFNGRNPSYDFDVKAIIIKSGVPVAIEPMPILSGRGHISVSRFGYDADSVILIPSWIPKSEADFDGIVSYSYSARLGSEISLKVTVLPNAINEKYIDFIAQINEIADNNVPRITVTKSGKTLISERNMAPLSVYKLPTYVYQLYVPNGWNSSEIKWDISYLGRSMVKGDLGNMRLIK